MWIDLPVTWHFQLPDNGCPVTQFPCLTNEIIDTEMDGQCLSLLLFYVPVLQESLYVHIYGAEEIFCKIHLPSLTDI